MMCNSITTNSQDIRLPLAIDDSTDLEWQDFLVSKEVSELEQVFAPPAASNDFKDARSQIDFSSQVDKRHLCATVDTSALKQGNLLNDFQNIPPAIRDTCRDDMLAWLSDKRNINDPNRQYVLDLSQGRLLDEAGQRAMITHEGRQILINWLDF